jgi:glutamate-ammonia-ligase adenylyltransferase
MNEARSAAALGAPDPADALRRFDRVAQALAGVRAGAGAQPLTADETRVLTVACQRAPYLATLLCRDGRRLGRVAADPYLAREKPRSAFAAEVGRAVAKVAPDDAAALALALRRYRADEMVRLGVREFRPGAEPEVGRELACLAEVCFDVAVAFHDRRLRAQVGPPRWLDPRGGERDAELAVIGMGKLGGQELNFCSDVDVLYVYSADEGSAGRLSLHEYFCDLARHVTATLGEVSEEDVVFRVDLRLRPEGGRGPIANSLASLERYYETWGRPWERQAWLKARPCAGSAELGALVVRTLAPFVFPRHVSVSVIADVADLNRRIKAELDASAIDRGFDVKNGVGGIREIEFFVQALQMIHAAHRSVLRVRPTRAALEQLLFGGLVTAREQEALAGAYGFLRHVEHVLQLEEGRQTQRLPTDSGPLARLARRLGLADADAFTAALGAHTAEVARLFATLGQEEAAVPAELTALLAGDLEPEATRAALGALGFRDGERAAYELERARRKATSPFAKAATGAAARIAPELLRDLAASPDPDQALGFLADLVARPGAGVGVWRLFDDNRELMRLIASLMGTSPYLARAFVDHPELTDTLVQVGHARPRTTRDELHELVADRWAGLAADDEEVHWNQLAELKQAQWLRIGMADIAGELSADAVGQELSHLADVCLERTYELAWRALAARHGIPRDAATGAPVGMAVLGLGKLGGQELGYASDLDIIFVHGGGDGETDGVTDGAHAIANVTFMSRLAQRLVGAMHALHPAGRLYDTDTRLRPEGQKGLLVSSLGAWRRYHAGAARLWERQALIKLRPVAGDAALGAEVAAAAAAYVYGSAPGVDGRETAAELALAILAMRQKIERELGGGRHALDCKVGPGGLVDIEFAAQYLQLCHGSSQPALRVAATLPTLAAIKELGLAEAHDCDRLSEGYRFLRTLEHRIRLVHDRSEHRLPTDAVELDKLARRVGHPGGSALEQSFRQVTRSVRGAYERILGGARP